MRTSEEEEEEDSSSNPDDVKQEESGCSEEYEANIWEEEGMFEVEDSEWVPPSRSLLPPPLHLLLLFFVEKIP